MRFAALLLMALIPASALAQGAAPPLALDEAIAQGLANSRRLAEFEARAEAADYAVSGRHAADMPSITVQGGYTRTNHVDIFAVTTPFGPPQVVYPDIPDNVRTRLDVQWPIYTGGRTDALERAARAERSAVGKDLDAARADLRLEITRAYWAAVTAGETEVALKHSLDAVQAHLADVRARLASGLIPPNDVSAAAAQAAHQRTLAIEAANLRAIAEADLARLVGRDSVTVAAVPPAPSSPPAETPVADLIARALRDRAERQGLQQRVVSANERAGAASATSKPQVALGGGYDYARPNPRIFPRMGEWQSSFDISVNVSWLLWDGGRHSAESGEARANAAALQARIEDFDRQVTFEVRARSLELASSRESVTAAEEGIRAAVDAERVVNERYNAGVATSTDVLDAQVARLQAELDRARAVASVRMAEARLERAIGR